MPNPIAALVAERRLPDALVLAVVGIEHSSSISLRQTIDTVKSIAEPNNPRF
jgi:hypothetical protein